jgi:hypothetical protein
MVSIDMNFGKGKTQPRNSHPIIVKDPDMKLPVSRQWIDTLFYQCLVLYPMQVDLLY